MKKRTIAALFIIVVLLLLGGLYWLGYLTFQNYIPSFTTNPGTTQPDSLTENEGAPRLTIENIRGRINKISVDIKNIGNQDAESVNWSISVTGGILKRIDLHSTGTITGSEPVIQTARGFKLLFFVVGVRM